MQAITQYAHIIYTKPMEIRMPHVVGAALAVAPMQGGGKPRPATVFPGNACGVQRKLYLCTFVARFHAKPLNDAQTGLVFIFIPYGEPRRNHTIPAGQ